MVRQNLNGIWRMRRCDTQDWIKGTVPGSVFNDLLNAGRIEDPFYRDNEDQAKIIASYDYEYTRDFKVDDSMLQNDNVLLHCDGLDTLAKIRINGALVANTHNMHRTYEFEIKDFLRPGLNSISITLASPTAYIAKKHEEYPIWGSDDAMAGFPHIRKGHSMFGWDWGPQIPDSGIWRNIDIRGYSFARLDDVYVTQHHTNDNVSLDVRVRTEKWTQEVLNIEVKVTDPDGNCIMQSRPVLENEEHINIEIDSPKLWWPNGYGDHPLYNVDILLKKGCDLLDSSSFNIGLRTLRVRRQKDKWGESFEFEINGVSIFAMGADYIPEDNLLPRCNMQRTEKLIRDCIRANFNCIRVWGGGIYPEDYFFDLCDRYGLIVWQDFMFACAVYDMNKDFTENIKKEAEDNIKRIRHHASLGLWCGNNEMEVAWVSWPFPKTAKLKTDYIKQFEIVIPEVVAEHDPNTFYWPSSPSSGGGFEDPNNENIGDVHYWDVWHGLKPFTAYRDFYFRFVSEFGFQSFPSLKTIETFTLPEDRNIFSYVMEKHQKNGSANGKILYYLSETFKYPKDFDSLLYASQLLQAEAIKYGVEHWRRNRGRCMGAIYWQLNDCWPVASWASIDYFGRWKALHYFAKKFFAPVLLSAEEEGTTVKLYVTNETMSHTAGTVMWNLRDNEGNVLKQGREQISVDPLNVSSCDKLDFSNMIKDYKDQMKTYLEYFLEVEGEYVSGGTLLFSKAKHFRFVDPKIAAQVEELEDRFLITVSTKSYAKYVELDIDGIDCVFSDNYFDVSKGTSKTVEVMKEDLSKDITLDEMKNSLKIRSIFDMA